MLSTLLGIEWLPVSMVGCDDCDLAGISFISAHPEISMSVPNEDIPGCRSFRTAMMHKRCRGSTETGTPSRRRQKLENLARGRETKSESQDDLRGKCDPCFAARIRSPMASISQSNNQSQLNTHYEGHDRAARPSSNLSPLPPLFHGCWHPRNRHERLRCLIKQLARILFFAQ
jgi:hypothetical protein